jgi:hypothetical protein
MLYLDVMSSSPSVTDVFAVAAAVIASLGGGGLLIFAMSSWLGRVWATRIMEREKTALTISIEHARADLTRSIERERAELANFHEVHRSELQELSSERQDALNRKRDVYTELATKMRVLLRANTMPAQQELDKCAFLAAYDKGYIWAAEAVIEAISDLIAALETKAAIDAQLKDPLTLAHEAEGMLTAESQRLDAEARPLYRRCMVEMRKDSGFQESKAEYRVISFG